MKGTTPRGARTEQEAAACVRGMFGRIAHRYDLANHLLSFHFDRAWRRHTARAVRRAVPRPEARSLDICCGTGDLLAAVARSGAGWAARPAVFGCDFCHPMLIEARRKLPAARLFEADALRLPVRDGSLDAITVAFGFRNLANYEAGLREMRRVLRGGGVAAILEFSQPRNRCFAALYNFYSRRVLPWIGGAISGSRDAYAYLPESVRKFPSAGELAENMRRAGFREVRYELLTGGIVALHLGTA